MLFHSLPGKFETYYENIAQYDSINKGMQAVTAPC